MFHDAGTADAFSIQLDPSLPYAGEFDYVVAGKGTYTGTAMIVPDGASGSTKISSAPTAKFQAAGAGSLTTVDLRLVGQVIHGDTLTLEIWTDGAHRHFETKPAVVADATGAAQSILVALATHDWERIYASLAPDSVKAFPSEPAFAAAANRQDGAITAATLVGTPTVSSTSGVTYFSQGVSLSVASDGSVATYKTTIYLVYEGNAWLLLGTDPPVRG